MKSNSFLVHLCLAAVVSFGISLAVWLLLDVFNPVGFVVASAGSALAGALAGWLSGRLLATTLMVVIAMRGAILYLAIAG